MVKHTRAHTHARGNVSST